MVIYETNAGLGYNQFAFLIRLDKTKNGYNYLCIGTQWIDDYSYIVGNIVNDLEDVYITTSYYKIEESPLYNTFLFDFFIKNYKN